MCLRTVVIRHGGKSGCWKLRSDRWISKLTSCAGTDSHDGCSEVKCYQHVAAVELCIMRLCIAGHCIAGSAALPQAAPPSQFLPNKWLLRA